jgi:hypothetical protein
MRTLTAQAAVSLCILVFAVLALRIARHVPASHPVFRFGWAFTGWAFLLRSLNSLVHDAFSIYGYLGGPESRGWATALVLHPILNHSRTFLLLAYCVVMCVVLVRADRHAPLPPLRTSMAIVAGGMLFGALVGWNEDAFSGLTHYMAVAVWDILELLALMAVLLVGISTASLNRGLWVCLGIYAFVLALSVLWFAFLSRIDVGTEWAPRPYHIQAVKAMLYVGMNVVTLTQLRSMRRGIDPRSFYDERPLRPSVQSGHL